MCGSGVGNGTAIPGLAARCFRIARPEALQFSSLAGVRDWMNIPECVPYLTAT